jgi:hypothetical protein
LQASRCKEAHTQQSLTRKAEFDENNEEIAVQMLDE